ncbi:MAG: DUF6265 family protein [Xanthomonadales bacterium]|nr:DUF6265 family protein [Xanthomonadales bacterium]
MKKHSLILFPLLLGMSLVCFGQAKFENTLRIDETVGSPTADLSAVAWIAGHWKGEALGGVVEEIWTPPLGGSMMAAFKLSVNNQVRFYELETIVEEDDTLILRLKHFSSKLLGWETQNETVDFKLVKVTPEKVYFDGMTFENVNDDEMNVYVIIGDEGQERETKFNYRKVIAAD